jgi:hypothetical protein
VPSLEDTPKLVSKTTPSGSDLVPIYDVTEVGNGRNKKATLLEILTATVAGLPGPFNDDAAAASGGVAIGSLYRHNGYGDVILALRSA